MSSARTSEAQHSLRGGEAQHSLRGGEAQHSLRGGEAQHSLRGSVGWALVLTASWTWCIGLFLPVLLFRLFGWAGFWTFAIPNVLGCTAFGWLAAGERGVRLRARLAGPIRWFALWTIAFQLFFLARVFFDGELVSADRVSILGVTAIVLIALWREPRRPSDRSLNAPPAGPSPQEWMWRAGACAALGALTWLVLLDRDASPAAAMPLLGESAGLWAAPFIALGFLTCPLLDPTFHWVSMQTPRKAPFALFGLFFAATLALTGAMGVSGAWHLPLIAGAFVISQVLFTAVLQARCVRWLGSEGTGARAGTRSLSVPVALAGMAGLAIAGLVWLLPTDTDITGSIPRPFDAAYLAFLGAYSAVFPALLLFQGRRARVWVWLAIAIAAALSVPGMFLGHTWMLAAAAGVVLVPAFAPAERHGQAPPI